MANAADLVLSIRERVRDLETDPHLYGDPTYDRALSRGLRRINFDLGTSYSIPTLPGNYEYLLELRGTIEMCWIRAAEGASGSGVQDDPDPAVQTVVVPNLTVSKIAKTKKGPDFWAELAEKLEREYESLLEDLASEGETAHGEIQQAAMYRTSLRTGRRTVYALDRALTAPALGVSVVNGTVLLSWEPVYSTRFACYRVERSSSVDFGTFTETHLITDNHEVSHKDIPNAGAWYYRLVVENDNGLKGYSAGVEAVVA